MNTDNIRAYAAGYVDGDGCIYLGKTIQKPKMITVYEYSVQIVSVKRPVLDQFKNVWGGYIIRTLSVEILLFPGAIMRSNENGCPTAACIGFENEEGG